MSRRLFSSRVLAESRLMRGFIDAGLLIVLCCTANIARAQSLPDAPSTSQQKIAHSFWGRWAQFYREDWSGTAASTPAPPRRGLPSPLSSPPFPMWIGRTAGLQRLERRIQMSIR